jgi:glycosyltransferase involved in cell wall biosynthesis
MKICLIVDDYMPHSIKVAAKMMHELACEFVAQGHEVSVITPSAQLEEACELFMLDGVNVWRFKSGEIKNVGKIKRAVNETLLPYRAWRALPPHFKHNRHDLIVYYSPTIFWGSLVERLKKLWGARSYLVLRDFFPQWAIDQGLIRKGSAIERYFRWFEAQNYSAADMIGLMSPKNLEWFQDSVRTDKPTEVLYNWASSETAADTGDVYRKELGLENKTVFFYGGNIGHAQDMMNIVRLAKNIRNEHNAHFVLVGAGDEVELVRSAIENDGVDNNMTLLPSVSQEVYQEMLAEFDVGLFSLHRDHTTHNFPGKLLGYMAYKKPILGSVNPGNDVQQVIEDAEAGFITINGDDKAFAHNALVLLRDHERRMTMGKNARQLLSDTFSVEAACWQILKSVSN